MFKERIALPVIVLTLVGGLLLGAYFIAGTYHVLEGSTRPELFVQSLSGTPTRLPVPFLGRHIIILFSPSCPHCSTELENYSRLARADRYIPCFGISLGPLKQTDSLVRSIGVAFPVFMDVNESVAEQFNVSRVPVLLFVDDRDVIQRVFVGSRSFQEDSLLHARFCRAGAPGASDVGSQEGTGVRLFPDAPTASVRNACVPPACPAVGTCSPMRPVGPRFSDVQHVNSDGPRQAVGPFIHSSFYKKEERLCVPRS